MLSQRKTYRTYIVSLILIAVVLIFSLGAHVTPAQADMAITIDEPFTGVSAPDWTLMPLTPRDMLTGGNTDAIGLGWLQLTNNNYNTTGSAFYNKPFSSDNGIQITFQYAIHDSLPNTSTGGDGFSFFLFSGDTITPTLGALGGALGYSVDLDNGKNGVTNGYVGIGFDEFGNFTTSRFGGCTITCTLSPTPQTVAIRGPGTNKTGYNLLKYVQLSALDPPHRVDNVTRANPRTVRITILNQKISVDMDFGNGFEKVIDTFDLTAAGVSAPPATFKMGFSGSTGGVTNFHEIRNLTVGGALTSTTTLQTPTSSLGTPIQSSVTGQPVTFTATVTPGQPSGTVTFFDSDGVTVIGVSTLDATTHQATFTTSALANGVHSITAHYEGDNTYGVSTSTPVSLEVISTSANLGDLLVSSAELIPPFTADNDSYTVNVLYDVTSITTTLSTAEPDATMTVNGNPATSGSPVTLNNLQVGPNPVTIVVTAPDGQTTHTYNVTVNRLALEGNQASITSLNASTARAVTGQPVTFTATVVFGAGAHSGQPSGTVTFLDGETAVGVGTLNPSQATFTTSALANGGHTITARYEGDTVYGVSTSAPISLDVISTNANLDGLLVNPGMLSPAFAADNSAYTVAVAYKDTSVTLTPSVADSTATLTLNGTPATSGSPVTINNIQVGANPISITVTAQDEVTIHTYTITVNRLGLGGNQVSTISLESSTISLVSGQTVILTATMSLTPTAPLDQPLPSGTVAFLDGETVIGVSKIGVGTPNPNQAVLTTTALLNGMRNVAARYEGDKFYGATTSTVIPVKVISTNAYLGSLQVSAGALSPAFATGTYSYTVSVPHAVTRFVIIPNVADSTATLTVDNAPATSGSPVILNNLQVGANPPVTFTVNAEDGRTTHTYSVTVNRSLSIVCLPLIVR
ncbi:MAG: cadherin-like beta sandwich domain-containing protein [Chloroflexales bacterium]